MSHTENKPCIVCEQPNVWLQTFEGKQLRVPEFNADAISLTETATVLSRICRFGGRTRVFYSVAEHSIRVAECVAMLGGTLLEQFYALNHEGDESLLGFDPPSPLLKLLPDLRDLKRKAHVAYMNRYDLPVEMPAIVKRADLILLATEKRDLMKPSPVEWACEEAPLAERIETFSMTPRFDFIAKWRALAAACGHAGEAREIVGSQVRLVPHGFESTPPEGAETVSLSVLVSDEALAAAVSSEPFRDGLPPKNLRDVWEVWEERDTGLTNFRGEEYRGTFVDGRRQQERRPMAEITTWFDGSPGWAFRPVNATWAHVEALATRGRMVLETSVSSTHMRIAAELSKPAVCPRCYGEKYIVSDCMQMSLVPCPLCSS